MRINITKKGQMLLTTVAIAAIGFGGYAYVKKHPQLLQRHSGEATTAITGVQLPSIAGQNESAATLKPVYTVSQVSAEHAGTLRYKGIPWNAQIGLIYANGGAQSAAGSIMQQYGVNVQIERQDANDILAAELLKFAQAYANGDEDPSVGSHVITIMGDGAAGFLAGLQPQLDKLNLHAKVIGAPGRSFGEDKFMGPPEWFDDPRKAKGGVVAGVLRDGDIHIVLIWAQQNNIKINPDPGTYDPDALNMFGTSSFAEADNAFITGKCETRPVVKDGKATGKSQKVCVNATATWTPGDVNVLRNNKTGVVSLLSTRENGAQMFATMIVIDEWARKNPATVTNFLKAALDGSAEVIRDRAKLRQAAGYSADVWKQENADYWEKYYYGRMEDSPNTGRQVRLGGSQALGLASNLEYFIKQGGQSVFDRVYGTFGDLDHRLYPDVMPDYPRDPVDPFFLEKIRASVGTVGRGDTFGKFDGSEAQVVGNRSYSINFAVGSATILPSSHDDLEQILNNVTVGSNLAIEVNGYASTDGNPESNRRLSEARAQSVRDYLVSHAAQGLITPERIRVTGFGSTNLLCNEGTETCHRQNRRVEIRLLGN